MGGHTGQHSPSGIVAPGQSTARQSTNCKYMKGFSDIRYQQSRISLASSMNVRSMHNVREKCYIICVHLLQCTIIELTAHFGGRVGGHTGQHSPSGIVAPEQLTKGQSTA